MNILPIFWGFCIDFILEQTTWKTHIYTVSEVAFGKRKPPCSSINPDASNSPLKDASPYMAEENKQPVLSINARKTELATWHDWQASVGINCPQEPEPEAFRDSVKSGYIGSSCTVVYLSRHRRPKLSTVRLLYVFTGTPRGYFTVSTVVLFSFFFFGNLTQKKRLQKILSLLDLSLK